MNDLETKIKQLIIDSLNLEDISIDDIDSTEALFVDGLGLDSIDALELGVVLQKEFNIKIKVQDDEIKKHFYSVRALAEFVSNQH
ncbi:phosphopantetheine-binding protein [Candidatus Odyssella acanthamoebae]|uniref:Acyl carrier protein n=1 Tax=Candidatus Odyssella acanthamoebae TaxID=91604 RepID=A0A077AVE3_9PROT|nr:phosphopantetheine-binding protein [Candidatus Paracaedibacter acanthamoebae]AIK96366.1 acyl carrier protein [Candidatus Paracaedibacter acanthamoebae]